MKNFFSLLKKMRRILLIEYASDRSHSQEKHNYHANERKKSEITIFNFIMKNSLTFPFQADRME